jgi:hypothetical protein
VLHVCENVWSVTTGRHLTWIDGGTPEAKKKRVSYSDFQKLKDIYGVEREYWLNSSYINPKADIKTVKDVINFDALLPDSLQLLKV